jgi:hypothetical protein
MMQGAAALSCGQIGISAEFHCIHAWVGPASSRQQAAHGAASAPFFFKAPDFSWSACVPRV